MHPKTLQNNIIYTNQFVTIYNEDISVKHKSTTPGSETQPVKNDKRKTQQVIVIAITNDNKIILNKKYHPEIDDHRFVIPTSNVTEKDIEQAATRTIKECTGFLGSKLRYVQRLIKNPKREDRCTHTFITKKLEAGYGKDSNHYFNLNQVIAMCEDQKIIDTASLLAINIYIKSLKK
jgi:hypothetical protein